ncbi:STAS-like domain-containing protein [Shewanella frigidimarina]|uniref:STAS-like domain-containing protein n=1 Tax=Shewanella frigidimarina TaxID=56812 RepID=UPI003FA04055
MKLNLAKDFSPNPFGRYRSDGPNSAERFRDDVLKNALNKCKQENDKLSVYLDDVPIGLGSSFLDEGFAGLVFKGYFTVDELKSLLEIKSEDSSYSQEIWSYIEEASRHAHP